MLNQVIITIKAYTRLTNEQLDAKIIALPDDLKKKVRAMIVANQPISNDDAEVLKEAGLLP